MWERNGLGTKRLGGETTNGAKRLGGGDVQGETSWGRND